jgi:hypothetical protein
MLNFHYLYVLHAHKKLNIYIFYEAIRSYKMIGTPSSHFFCLFWFQFKIKFKLTMIKLMERMK